MSTQVAKRQTAPDVVKRDQSILGSLASKYGVAPERMLASLKQVAFRQAEGKTVSDEQMVALLVVANQYGLNPFTKEIYAFPDKGGIVPVVGVDGWNRIMSTHPAYDGEEIEYSEEILRMETSAKDCPAWCRVTIHRKDMKFPTINTEFLDEVYRPGLKPWQTHTKRMLTHKARIQAARRAFGFSGIKDEDEAQRIVEAEVVSSETAKKAPAMMPRRVVTQAVPASELPQEPVEQSSPTAWTREQIETLAQEKGAGKAALDGIIQAELGFGNLSQVPNEQLGAVADLLGGI